MINVYDGNIYRAMILRHVDADTTEIEVDLGFDVRTRLTVRWDGLDAPERGTPEGQAALVYVNQMLPPGAMVHLMTIKDKKEKYGRYLGTFLALVNGYNFNLDLIERGHAVPYHGERRTPV